MILIMNYLHAYHAGNFADVMKHSILTLLVDYLEKKPSAYTYIDSHAGSGIYDLTSEYALKTEEAELGIIKLFQVQEKAPVILQKYFNIISSVQTGNDLTIYPGSPSIVRHLVRPQDNLILNEKHESTYFQLKKNFAHDPQVTIHKRDAYEFLGAILPPKTTRGLVLMDPPFEKKSEREDMTTALEKCLRRFKQGVYLIWYALTDKQPDFHIEQQLYDLLQVHPHLLVEMRPHRLEPHKGLIGSLVLIINPPFTLQENLHTLMPFLTTTLSEGGHGKWRIFQYVH